MKLMFVSDKPLNECNPELVEKLLHTTSYSDVCDVEEEIDVSYEEIVDTMFAIVREKRVKNHILNEKAMNDWLYDYFMEHILGDIEREFGEGINKKRFQKKSST